VPEVRRAALIVLLLVAPALIAARDGGSPDHYRVAAVFSNTAGLIPGQNVEIAGAVVGQVKAIDLTPDHRARVEMDLQTGFAPFHSDATCDIKPQSLIGEKFIECDPGTPDAAPLRAATVPLARTHAPVDIDLVFAALRRPYVQRLSLVVNELGTGLAGRPRELQQAIRRAAPALQEADRVLAIVNRDRDRLGRLIDRTDEVLAQLAPRDRDVGRFIDRANAAAAEVAGRRDDLGRAIDKLPPLLDELEPSANSLASAAADARPVVHELSDASPQLRALFDDLAPLTDAGRPALRALRSASDEGRKAVAAARPVASKLQAAAKLMPHVTDLGAQLTKSLRDNRSVEALQLFTWLGTASMGRFDAVSHIVPSYQLGDPQCHQYATTPVEGCSAHFAAFKGQKAGAKRARQRRTTRRRQAGARRTPRAQEPARTTPPAPSKPAPERQPPPLEQLQELIDRLPPPPGLPLDQDLPGDQDLLDYLMGR
jgi:virulence factor Mce-like protein